MPRMINRNRSHFGGQGGFTLIEVVMVLLILGIISYFATTRLFPADAPTQNAEMELVKNHLRYAQSRAMNTETNWGIVFDSPPSKKYQLYYENESGNKVAVRLPGDETSPENVKKMALQSLSIASIANSLYSNEVKFYCGSAHKPSSMPGKFGSPSISNESANNGNITITTSAGSITIRKNTGFIP
jgi:prepilin-type N-terminal cleavage/methylation domain-containing protein